MTQRNRSRHLVAAVALLFVGLIGIWGMGESALERIRPADLLRLLAAGGCLGVALMAMVQYFWGRPPGAS